VNWEETAAAIGSALAELLRSLAPTLEGVLLAFGRMLYESRRAAGVTQFDAARAFRARYGWSLRAYVRLERNRHRSMSPQEVRA